MKLTRLTDRIDTEDDGSEIVVKRYGMWGTHVEIVIKNKKIDVVYANGKRERFKTLGDAEDYLKELVEGRRPSK